MSEIQLEQNNSQETTLVRRFRNIMRPSEAEVVEIEVIEPEAPVDIYQHFEVISDDLIKANKKHDLTVARNYELAGSDIENVNEFATSMRTNLYSRVAVEKVEVKKELVSRTEQIDAHYDLMIATIEQRRHRDKQEQNLEYQGALTEANDKKERADELYTGNMHQIDKIKKEIEAAQNAEARIEQERDAETEEFNELVLLQAQLVKDLEKAEKDVEKHKKNLFKFEERQEDLYSEETDLRARERHERKKLAQPAIDQLVIETEVVSEGADEGLPQGVQEAIKNIQNDVESIKLSEILGNLDSCLSKQAHNQKTIDNLVALISQTEFHINNIKDELEKTVRRLNYLEADLKGRLTDQAVEVQAFSAYIQQVANTFSGVLQGDITEIAKQTLPARFEELFNNVVEYTQAAAPNRKEIKPWQAPTFDKETFDLSFNMNGDEPAPSIEEEAARVVNTKNGAKLLENSKIFKIGGTVIGRTLNKPGVRIEVRPKEEVK